MLGLSAYSAVSSSSGKLLKRPKPLLDYQCSGRMTLAAEPLPEGYEGIDIPEMSQYFYDLWSKLPEPKLVFKHFMLMLQTPRRSTELANIQAYLRSIAVQLDAGYSQDEIGNVVLSKPATKGYGLSPGVVIQCHMDMVGTKTEDSEHDFKCDSIQAYITDDKQWLTATKTSLGADDGIGVAVGLSLFEDPTIKHGPIELLITVDEEVGLLGAKSLKRNWLKNASLINVDGGEEHSICIGCAGGFEKSCAIALPVKQIESAQQLACLKISISGLTGGHSGINIHLGRANANVLLARVLNYLIVHLGSELRLVSIDGGNAHNAIPSSSNCEVLVGRAEVARFKQLVNEYWDCVYLEFEDAENENLRNACLVTEVEPQRSSACGYKDLKFLVNFMMNLPHGVVRMNPDPSLPDLVQTSINFATIVSSCSPGNYNNQLTVECGLFARSPSMFEMQELNRKLDCFIDVCAGGKYRRYLTSSGMLSVFNGWDPDTDSALLGACEQAHMALFGAGPDVYAVHSGLECGVIKERYPQMDCVSIGPLIKDKHSTDERMSIATVMPFYRWLRETVARVAKKQITSKL